MIFRVDFRSNFESTVCKNMHSALVKD